MEAILVDALGNQSLQGAARSSLLRGSRFIHSHCGAVDLLAEPVTLASIYGRALFLAPLVPRGCFLSAHSAAWVWAGYSHPPQTIYIASFRRPRRAADCRYWIQLDAPSQLRLKQQGIYVIGCNRGGGGDLNSQPARSSLGATNDFVRIGKVNLLSPPAALNYCDQHPHLAGKDCWNRALLLALADRLFPQSTGGAFR
ncbi:hypothetical protein [Varibaculum cambriense]|uniref:hypothetical protein n=1 Tax=Varibaculum cambriense TaxID=184870 RepID=UPI002915B3C6|nr:hypothetical protein [Varibaculum cambriense]MDU5542734.1 hypothetical protein [Varibaculum cambriense]